MTDSEIDIFVKALVSPPPCGFTEFEREQILNWLKGSSFIDAVERRVHPVNRSLIQFFQYEKTEKSS